MSILSFIWSKIGRICTVFDNYHIYWTQCARSAPKNFDYGGGPMAWWGGIKDFPDGGGQASMGGTRVWWGGPPHPPPHLVTLMGEGLLGFSWWEEGTGVHWGDMGPLDNGVPLSPTYIVENHVHKEGTTISPTHCCGQTFYIGVACCSGNER